MNQINNEVIETLITIKDHCVNCESCLQCKLGSACDRYFSKSPNKWNVPPKEKKNPVVYIKPVKDGKVPEKKTDGAAAWDCYAREGVDVYNGETYKVPLGFALAMPEGVCAFLLPRSSMGIKTDLIMANSMGLIDSDYCGEVKAIYKAFNIEWDVPSYLPESSIRKNDRVAQLFFNVPNVEIKVVDDFPDEVKETERGEGGFGSTGK